MIVVIADDITGAAEIAGVGLRFGLNVYMTTTAEALPPRVQLWVIALDTRSMNRTCAVQAVTDTVKRLLDIGVKDIFKKLDSLLRGHVMSELAAQRILEHKKKVLLCPANPEKRRLIVNGKYLVDGIPLGETEFSKDPEFPAKKSIISEMLGVKNMQKNKIIVVNASSVDDLLEAAKRKDDQTILAGSAAFFTAYLLSLEYVATPMFKPLPVFENALFVCGSAYGKSRERVEKSREAGANVAYISPLLTDEQELLKSLEDCTQLLVTAINAGETAILTISEPVLKGNKAARMLKQSVVTVVKKVLAKVKISEMVVEGGATAYAIIEELKYRRFIPTHEFADGVVRMSVGEHGNMHLTIKPGSYDFPEAVWKFPFS